MQEARTPALDQSAIAKSFRDRGFSCELWVDGPGQVWADFAHSTDELVVVLRGEVEFEFGGTVHRPERGEELLIPAGARHTVRNLGARSEWLYGYKQSR